MEAGHNGYKTLFSGCLHNRKILLSDRSLTITDSLNGNFIFAKSRFFIHPQLAVSFNDDILQIKGKNFIMTSNLVGKSAFICDSTWHPEFGVSVPNKVLEVEFDTNQLEIIFKWTLY